MAVPARDPVDLSVVTPSYGYAQFIADAVESVAAQDGLRIEHIVQDGGSDDGTLDVLRGYGDDVDWVSEPDRGQSDALNRAIARACGRWVAWLNADEFYLPSGLAALVAEGEATGADVVYGDTAFCDADGRLTRLVPQHRFSAFVLRNYGCFIGTVSCIVRRSALGAEPIDAEMRRMMDWDLYLRLEADGRRFRHVPVPVGVFRAHDVRVTATERRGFFQQLNLADGFGEEYEAMRTRYGAMRARRAGHLAHGMLKLVDGAYARQLRARRQRGRQLRWFSPAGAEVEWERVCGAVYPGGPG
jgi:glycosyltransferase involved in cell wall biosynthesis